MSSLVRGAMLAATVTSATADAAEADTQLWAWVQGSGTLVEDVRLTIDAGYRAREAAQGDQQFARAVAELKVSPAISIGAGGAAFDTRRDGRATGRERRAIQQIVAALGKFAGGTLASRSMLEERWFGGNSAVFRARQRLRWSRPLDDEKRWTFVGTAEALVNLNSAGSQRSGVESWRTSATLNQALTKAVGLNAGYLLIYAPRAGGPDRVSHVGQLSLSISL